MNVTLLPRLSQIAVDGLLEEYGDAIDVKSSLDFVRKFPESMSYAPSGGSPLPKEKILEIRQALVAAAEKHGFPDRGTPKARAQFDTDVTEFLGEHPLFVAPEALRDDVWAFISAVVAPDIVTWRFISSAPERFHGGVRNAFQRLWMRAWSLDRGPEAEERWALIRELTEDAFGQIVERPSIGGDRRIALALAEGWVRMSQTAGRGAMEPIMRRAVIGLRLKNQIQMLSALDDASLEAAVDMSFERARVSLGIEGTQPIPSEGKAGKMSPSPGSESASIPVRVPEKATGSSKAFSRLSSLFTRQRTNSGRAEAPLAESRKTTASPPEPIAPGASGQSHTGQVHAESEPKRNDDQILQSLGEAFEGTGPLTSTPDENDLIWNEVIIPVQSEVRMRYKQEWYYARVEGGKICDTDGEFTPSEWAIKVASGTSRNAWRDLYFRGPNDSGWILANEIRNQARAHRK